MFLFLVSIGLINKNAVILVDHRLLRMFLVWCALKSYCHMVSLGPLWYPRDQVCSKLALML